MTSEAKAPVVEGRGLGKTYRDGSQAVEVLRGVDVEVLAGRSLALTGPSGSGKSTLLNLFAGLISADTGELYFTADGQRHKWHLASQRERTRLRRRYIGYVHQFFNLIPTLTVLENVRLPGRLNVGNRLDARALELLAQFGLDDRAGAFPDVLSGGEQQRVAVARALLLEPPLLLADEPTGNLDAGNSNQVVELLFGAARESGVSLIIATHSETVAAQADDRLDLGG